MKLFHILTSFFARSLTLVPRSLIRNRTETLATQARSIVIMHDNKLITNLLTLAKFFFADGLYHTM